MLHAREPEILHHGCQTDSGRIRHGHSHLYVRDAARAIDFYSKAFGAIELYRLANPDGRMGHAEILIGTSRIMLADEFPEMNVKGPQSLEGTSVSFLIYVEDVDAQFDRAIAAGATVLGPLKDQMDRSAFRNHYPV